MKNNLLKIGTVVALAAIPVVTFGQTGACSTYTLACLVSKITQYLQIGIMLIVSFAVITFVWNIYRYFFTEKDKKEAGLYVLYSTVGFFVIFSLWGLVAILTNTLNLPNNTPSWWPFATGGSNTSTNGIGNTPPPNFNGATINGTGNTPPPNFNGIKPAGGNLETGF